MVAGGRRWSKLWPDSSTVAIEYNNNNNHITGVAAALVAEGVGLEVPNVSSGVEGLVRRCFPAVVAGTGSGSSSTAVVLLLWLPPAVCVVNDGTISRQCY